MSNFNIRVVGTANVKQMQAEFQRLQAQVELLNNRLRETGHAVTGVNPQGFQDMNRMIAQNSATFRSAAASTGLWETEQLRVTSATENYTKALEKQKLSFRDIIRQQGVARAAYREQLAMQNMMVRQMPGQRGGKTTLDIAVPTEVSKDLDTLGNKIGWIREQTRSASTQMINWGKNTQWAGRQLMVGFTLPMAAFGAAAGVMAYQVDEQMTRIRKVYDLAADQNSTNVKEMARVNDEFARLTEASFNTARGAAQQYGVSMKDTLGVQADLAATGQRGTALQSATTEVVKNATLGEIDYQTATKATIAMQQTLHLSTKQLSDTWAYMNSVENSTSLGMKDFATAIPIALGPIQQMGGGVKELGLLLTAMSERGIQVGKAANAIKSAMQRLANPSKQVQEQFKAITGASIVDISNNNKGNLVGMLKDIRTELDGLSRQDTNKALASLFGSYQVGNFTAMLGGLSDLDKGIGQISETQRIGEQTAEQWSQVQQQEIAQMQKSASGQFKIAVASMQGALASVGRPFLEIGTFILKGLTAVVKAFDGLPDLAKKGIIVGAGIMALVGPMVMLVGLTANFAGNLLKMLVSMTRFAGSMQILNKESKAAALAADLAKKGYLSEVESIQLMTTAIEKLTLAQIAANKASQPAPFANMGAYQGKHTLASTPTPVLNSLNPNSSAAPQSIYSTQAVAAVKASETTKRNWGAVGTNIAVAGGALAMMNMTGDGVVSQISKMVFYASLISPAVFGAVKAIKALGVASLVATNVGKISYGFALLNKNATMFYAKLMLTRGTMASMGALTSGLGSGLVAMLGPVGLLTAGLAAAGAATYLIMRHMNDAKQAVGTMYDDADALGKILNYSPTEPIGHVFDEAGNSVVSTTEKVKQFKDAYGSVVDEIRNAKTEQEALRIALSQGQKVIDTGGTVEQAQEAVKIAYQAGRGQALNETKIPLELKARLDFGNVANQVKTLIEGAQREVDKASKPKQATSFHGMSVSDSGASEAQAKKAGELAGRAWATAFDNGLSTRPIEQEVQKQLDALNEQAKSVNFEEASDARANKEALIRELMQGQVKDMDKYIDKVKDATTVEELLAGTTLKRNHEVSKSVQAQMDYEQVLKDQSKSDTKLSRREQLQLLNVYRVKAGLEKTGAVVDGMGDVTKKWNSATDDVFKAAAKVTGQHKKTLAIAQQISDEEERGLKKSAMTEYQQGIADQTTAKMDAQAEAATAAVQAQGEARLRAFEQSNERATRLLEERQTREADAMTARHERVAQALADRQEHESQALANRQEAATQALANRQEAATQALSNRQEMASQALQRRQEDESAALDRRMENAQNALDRRQERRQKAVEGSYDKRIKAIQDQIKAEQKADDLRKRIFDAEMTRLDRLNESANSNIDFNVAINSGKLDEAARIRNEAEARTTEYALTDAQARAEQQSGTRQDRQQGQIDTLEENKKKALDRLAVIEKAEDASLKRRQEKQKRWLSRRQQAEDNALKRRQQHEETMLKRLQQRQDMALKRRQQHEDNALKRRQQHEDAALKRAQAHEEKSLKKRQATEQRYLKRQQDRRQRILNNDVERTNKAEQRKWEYRKKRLADSLEDFMGYVAMNDKDLKKHIKRWNKSHKDMSLTTQGYFDASSKHVKNFMVKKIREGRRNLSQDKAWETLGSSIGKKMVKGSFGLNMNQFKKWMHSGIMPKDRARAAVATNQANAKHKDLPTRHEGGPIGGSGKDSRKGVARTVKGLHPSEQLVRAQKGEFMVNRQAYAKNKNLVEAINDGKPIPNSDGRKNTGGFTGPLGFAGLMAGVMGAATKSVLRTSIMEGARMARAREAAMFGGGGRYTAAAAGRYGDSSFNADQLKNAATIANVGKRLGASNRDIKIALMTAMQESTLRNLSGGDRDSVGLFQQRAPWGSFADRHNPAKAAEMFFKGGQGGQRGLFDFAGRNTMSLAAAAQAVQVSAFPGAYAKWQDEAAAIMKGMTYVPGMMGIAGGNRYNLPGVKPWVKEAAEYLGAKYNIGVIGGVGSRGNVSDHPRGLALDYMLKNKSKGDALAADVIAHHKLLDAKYVIWRQRIISAKDGWKNWRPMADRGSPTANHFDHVHVSFMDNGDVDGLIKGTAPVDGATGGTGGIHRPVRGGRISQGTHDSNTGFPAYDISKPVGSPVFAAHSGKVVVSKDLRGYEPRVSHQNGYRSYGRYVVIDGPGARATLYAHLNQRYARQGQHVEGGATIGRSGNTGHSYGPHLHFGAHNPGPQTYLNTGGYTTSDGRATLHENEVVISPTRTAELYEGLDTFTSFMSKMKSDALHMNLPGKRTKKAAATNPGNPNTEASGPRSGKGMNLRTGTLNLFKDSSAKSQRQDVARLLGRADVLSLTEYEKVARSGNLKGWLAKRNWGVHMARGGTFADTAVAWNQKRFKYLGGDTMNINPDVKSKGGGRSRMAAYAHLQDRKSGTKFWQVATHLVNHASKNYPRILANQMMNLGKLYRRLSRTGPVVMAGDWNATPTGYHGGRGTNSAIPGAYSNWARENFKRGTSGGGSKIDAVLTGKGNKFLDSQIVRGLKSDHDALLAQYHIPGLAKGAQNIRWDNTIANLHKGESVLTEDYSQKFRQGMDNFASGGNAEYNVNMHIYRADINADELVTKTITTLKRHEARKPQSRRR